MTGWMTVSGSSGTEPAVDLPRASSATPASASSSIRSTSFTAQCVRLNSQSVMSSSHASSTSRSGEIGGTLSSNSNPIRTSRPARVRIRVTRPTRASIPTGDSYAKRAGHANRGSTTGDSRSSNCLASALTVYSKIRSEGNSAGDRSQCPGLALINKLYKTALQSVYPSPPFAVRSVPAHRVASTRPSSPTSLSDRRYCSMKGPAGLPAPRCVQANRSHPRRDARLRRSGRGA